MLDLVYCALILVGETDWCLAGLVVGFGERILPRWNEAFEVLSLFSMVKWGVGVGNDDIIFKKLQINKNFSKLIKSIDLCTQPRRIC